MKTNEEVQAEIKALQEIKPNVRQMTIFGDDNHQAIEAQIKVLKGKIDEDGIYRKWEDNDHLRDSALEALAWLEGKSDSLAEGWKELT